MGAGSPQPGVGSDFPSFHRGSCSSPSIKILSHPVDLSVLYFQSDLGLCLNQSSIKRSLFGAFGLLA